MVEPGLGRGSNSHLTRPPSHRHSLCPCAGFLLPWKERVAAQVLKSFPDCPFHSASKILSSARSLPHYHGHCHLSLDTTAVPSPLLPLLSMLLLEGPLTVHIRSYPLLASPSRNPTPLPLLVTIPPLTLFLFLKDTKLVSQQILCSAVSSAWRFFSSLSPWLALSHPSVSLKRHLPADFLAHPPETYLLPSVYSRLDSDDGGNISFTYSTFLSTGCLPGWPLSPTVLSVIYLVAYAVADARVLGTDGFKLAPFVCCALCEELGGGDSARASQKERNLVPLGLPRGGRHLLSH